MRREPLFLVIVTVLSAYQVLWTDSHPIISEEEHHERIQLSQVSMTLNNVIQVDILVQENKVLKVNVKTSDQDKPQTRNFTVQVPEVSRSLNNSSCSDVPQLQHTLEKRQFYDMYGGSDSEGKPEGQPGTAREKANTKNAGSSKTSSNSKSPSSSGNSLPPSKKTPNGQD